MKPISNEISHHLPTELVTLSFYDEDGGKMRAAVIKKLRDLVYRTLEKRIPGRHKQ